jgi:hypothetical protein
MGDELELEHARRRTTGDAATTSPLKRIRRVYGTRYGRARLVT